MSGMYAISSSHSLTSLAAYALASTGIRDKAFEEEKYRAIRKNIILDEERKRVMAELEKEQIWHCPLKGSVIKDWYPAAGMRQMADNDILCDESRMSDVKSVMERLGFTTVIFGKSHQDVYRKPPVCNFEMHARLFEPRHDARIYAYYADIKSKLVKDADNEYGYHLSNEDFYIYTVAHEYKHFVGAGTGLRSLVDTYVMLRHFGDALDMDYIVKELDKLGIAGFEAENRSLALTLFSGNKLSDEQRQLLDKYIFAGTYGNFNTRLSNSKVEKGARSKIRYILRRLSLPEQTLKEFHPFFYRHRCFRPALYTVRLVRKALFHRKALASEIKELVKYK
ncbi:MAG: nucleotidyltransferase family protein [Oscillospiraceae bacterium]|nr:nucleotidyltransferase family protein [Oscillospiraceae bacterium]